MPTKTRSSKRIEDAAAKTPFVIVDLEGTASKTVMYAISQADFVVIPTQGSQLDANEASRAIRVVLQSEKMTGKAKPYAVLLTRTTPSIRTRGLTHIQNGLIDAGIPVLETELNERDAFKAVFSFQQTLDGLNPAEVPNLDKAKTQRPRICRGSIRAPAAEEGGRKENQTIINRGRCSMSDRVNPFAISRRPAGLHDETEAEKPVEEEDHRAPRRAEQFSEPSGARNQRRPSAGNRASTGPAATVSSTRR